MTMTDQEKIEAWNLLEDLRSEEGSSVTIMCDNPDGDGPNNDFIEWVSSETEWVIKIFIGTSVLAALRKAKAWKDGARD